MRETSLSPRRAEPPRPPAARLRPSAALAPLAGCATSDRLKVSAIASDDYKLRHPIALAQDASSIDVFPAARRAARPPHRQADRHAGRGIPAGRPGADPRPAPARRRARDQRQTRRGDPRGARPHRRPRPARRRDLSRRRPPARLARAPQLRRPEGQGGRPVRGMAERPRLGQLDRRLGKPAILQFRLRHAEHDRRADGRSARPRDAARRGAGGYADPQPRHREHPQGPGSHHRLVDPGHQRSAAWAGAADDRHPVRHGSRDDRAGPAHFHPGVLRNGRRWRRSSATRRPSAAWRRPTSRSTWAASPPRLEAYRSAPTPNIIVIETCADAGELLAGARVARRILRRRHQGDGRSAASTTSCSTASSWPGASATTSSCRSTCSTSSARSPTSTRRPMPSRSARSSPSPACKGGGGASVGGAQPRLVHRPRPPAADRHRRHGPRLRHRRARLQPGSAAGHRRSRLRARPARRQPRRPPAVALHGPAQHPRRAGDARPRLRPSRRGLRSPARHPARRPRPSSCSTSRICGAPGAGARSSAPTRSCIVAAPDLASLRNAKSMIDTLRARASTRRRPASSSTRSACPSARRSRGGFRQGGRPQITCTIPFEPKLFGTAANNGQMIVEVEATNKIAELISDSPAP